MLIDLKDMHYLFTTERQTLCIWKHILKIREHKIYCRKDKFYIKFDINRNKLQ